MKIQSVTYLQPLENHLMMLNVSCMQIFVIILFRIMGPEKRNTNLCCF